MPDTNSTAQKPLVPSITGYPLLDTLLRIGLTSGSAALTAVILTWLNAHGFNDPNLSVMIGGAILTTLIGAATVGWSLIQAKLNQLSIVQHVMNAAATGEIPENIKLAAIKAPSVSEETITKALNNAETIKAAQ